jgi:hypothetical protein
MLDSRPIVNGVSSLQRLSFILFLVLPLGANADESIFRSYDANGQVIYSDRPEGENAERIVVSTLIPLRTAAAAAAAEPSAGAATAATLSAATTQPPTVDNTPPTPSRAERNAQRERNCEQARQNAASYEGARRMYRETPDGERVYLTDEEIDETRAKAQADVATWCG